MVTGRKHSRVREPRGRVGRLFRPVEADHFGAPKRAFEAGLDRVVAEKPGRDVGDFLVDVRQPEHRFVEREILGHALQGFGQFADLFLRNLDRLAGRALDLGLDVDRQRFRFFAPARVAKLRIVVMMILGLARDLVDVGRPRGVDRDVESGVLGRLDDRHAALRPLVDELVRQPVRDLREGPFAAVLFHPDADSLLQVPRESSAVERPRRLLPPVDRLHVKRPELSVRVRLGDVEDRAVGMQLRIVRARRSVLEDRAADVCRHDLDDAVLVPDPGVGNSVPGPSVRAPIAPLRGAPARSLSSCRPAPRPTAPTPTCRPRRSGRGSASGSRCPRCG